MSDMQSSVDAREIEKSEFLRKLRENLQNTDASQEDRLVDESRSLILGP